VHHHGHGVDVEDGGDPAPAAGVNHTPGWRVSTAPEGGAGALAAGGKAWGRARGEPGPRHTGETDATPTHPVDAPRLPGLYLAFMPAPAPLAPGPLSHRPAAARPGWRDQVGNASLYVRKPA